MHEYKNYPATIHYLQLSCLRMFFPSIESVKSVRKNNKLTNTM